MSVNLSQFHQVFIEESIEGLDVMESALMDLDPPNIDDEKINTIFRSAHSIKGGSATFGFTAIAEFTHVLETLLDQVRSGTRSMVESDVNLLLKSVDCMRELLSTIEDGVSKFTPDAIALKRSFERRLNDDSADETKDEEAAQSVEVDASNVLRTWLIRFVASEDLLKTGNDPGKMFQALTQLGDMEVVMREQNMPRFRHFDPESLYLSWDITLSSGCDENEIRQHFEWVEDECDINIEQNVDVHSWEINFISKPCLFKSGNDPMRLFQALGDIGRIDVIECDHSGTPPLKSMDPEDCHMSWRLELSGAGAYEDIKEVFEWVEDEADIQIKLLGAKELNANLTETNQNLGINAKAASEIKDQVAPTGFAGSDSIPLVAKAVATKPEKRSSSNESTSIRVGIDKVDTLINMVGELVITQSMLGQIGEDFDASQIPKLIEGLNQLEQNTRELQESVMRIRMLPISFAFSRFPRMVRDLSQQLGKEIHLEMFGDQTELDKTVMEKIGDPLVHLVRNAVDHGIETPDKRIEAGKPKVGKIVLNAYHMSGNVVIEIQDDGKGLDKEGILNKAVDKGIITYSDAKQLSDEQVYDLIFQPGFSTAAVVSDVSGRGVGMDVVRRNIQALNGAVEVQSQLGSGSKMLIRLPLTLAILDGQLVQVAEQVFVFPLVSIVESIQCSKNMVNDIAGGCKVFKLRDEFIPIVRLDATYGINTGEQPREIDGSLMVVVESDREKFGIVVDELLAQQQVVIKSLEQNYRRVEGVSGATILGDGKVALIIDIPGVVKLAGLKDASCKARQENSRQAMFASGAATSSSVDPRRLQA